MTWKGPAGGGGEAGRGGIGQGQGLAQRRSRRKKKKKEKNKKEKKKKPLVARFGIPLRVRNGINFPVRYIRITMLIPSYKNTSNEESCTESSFLLLSNPSLLPVVFFFSEPGGSYHTSVAILGCIVYISQPKTRYWNE